MRCNGNKLLLKNVVRYLKKYPGFSVNNKSLDDQLDADALVSILYFYYYYKLYIIQYSQKNQSILKKY